MQPFAPNGMLRQAVNRDIGSFMIDLFCFGLGFSAKALTRRLAKRSDIRITGTSRSAQGAERIASDGHSGLVFDGLTPSTDVAKALERATHVVVSISPDEAGDPVLAHHSAELAGAPNLKWIGYLSTVGVYGDQDGRWVDEATPVNPISKRSKRRVVAEDAWLAFGAETGKHVQVFRLAGIYGPGRSAIDNLQAGTARRIVKPGQIFNRIHADDIALVLEAAMSGRGSFDIYNVTDNEPAPPQDVVAYAAGLMGIPPPPEIAFEDANLSPMGRSFYSERKRVANTRIREDLGVALDCPTYREGMRAVWEAVKDAQRSRT